MEQKTEASQAVDENSILREALNRIRDMRFGWDGDCGVTSIAEDALAEADALKAQPAPTEAQEVHAPAARMAECLTFLATETAPPDRHTLQAEGTHPAPCARHCEATAFGIEMRRLEAENAQLRAAEQVHAPAERMAECKAFLATLPAQGEHSARLDAADLATIEEATKVLESAAKHNEGLGRTVFAHAQRDRAVRLRAILDRARASAETGGVKS